MSPERQFVESTLLPESGESQLMPAAENPLEIPEAQLRVKEQIERVRSAYNRSIHSLFELGDELIELRNVMTEADKDHNIPTRELLASKVGIAQLSAPRISQIMLTAEAFPKEKRKDGIDFKAYEVARELNVRSVVRRDAEELSKIVEDNPSSNRVRTAIEKTEAQLIVGVRRMPDQSFKAFISGDGKDHQLAKFVAIAELEHSVQTLYGNNLDALKSFASELKFPNNFPPQYRFRIANRLRKMIQRLEPSEETASVTVAAEVETEDPFDFETDEESESGGDSSGATEPQL